MSLFHKKPVVIEARRFTGESSAINICNWAADGGEVISYYPDTKQLGIATLEGDMTADLGDWIIRGIAGEFYPCRSDIFVATYEEVE